MRRIVVFLLVGLLCLPALGTFAQQVKPEITSFSVTGESFLEEGEYSTLSWTSKNATYCMAENDWSGTKGPSGSHNFYPSTIGYGKFRLTCYDDVGNASAPIVLTPFVGSSTTMKQVGSLAVVSAKATS